MAYRKLKTIGCSPCHPVPTRRTKKAFLDAAVRCAGVICPDKPAEKATTRGQKPVRINRLDK